LAKADTAFQAHPQRHTVLRLPLLGDFGLDGV
jgi:hypothetical protein